MPFFCRAAIEAAQQQRRSSLKLSETEQLIVDIPPKVLFELCF